MLTDILEPWLHEHNRFSHRGLPLQLLHYQHAPAYYGVMREVLSADSLPDDQIANMAIQVEAIIERHKIRDWRHNQDIQNQIWNAVEDYLYDLNLSLSGADLDLIIAQVIDIAKKR